jgi:hypothetical protein
MDKDLLRFKRRQSFLENRKRAYKEVMENHPEGMTKDNLEQIKKEIKEEESNIA